MSGRVRLTTLAAADLRRHMADFLKIAADAPGEYWTSENFLLELPEKWSLSVAAWDAESPVGYAVLSRKAPDQVHLHHFMVAPGRRESGLGKRLLDEVASRARASGAARLTLKVHNENARARRFYVRHGFREAKAMGAYTCLERALTETPTDPADLEGP